MNDIIVHFFIYFLYDIHHFKGTWTENMNNLWAEREKDMRKNLYSLY